jgi:hypothetical protein
MFLLYHPDRCNTSEMVFHWCYVNDLHTTHAVVCWVTTGGERWSSATNSLALAATGSEWQQGIVGLASAPQQREEEEMVLPVWAMVVCGKPTTWTRGETTQEHAHNQSTWDFLALWMRPGSWYVTNVSIIFDAPCLFYTNCFVFWLHFMAFLCIFWN